MGILGGIERSVRAVAARPWLPPLTSSSGRDDRDHDDDERRPRDGRRKRRD